jgi:ribose transport system permease protein
MPEPLRAWRVAGSRHLSPQEILWAALPFFALAAMLAIIVALRPTVFSYFGFNLLLKLSIPLVFASMAQMLVIGLGDIDLSIGSFVGFVTCVTAVYLDAEPWLGASILAAGVLGFGAVGLLIHLRRLPSIIVTLGMSFIWLGLAILILPAPGGRAPAWLTGMIQLRLPLFPLPLWVAVLVAWLGHFALMRSSYGVILRGTGGNPKAIARAGWSLLRARLIAYMSAGLLGVLSGLTLSGVTTSGDPNIAPTYTLLSVAAVILGGGSFVGGVVSPVGTVVGAITLGLAGSVLSFLHIPPVWQIGAQGCILLAVLAGRSLLRGPGR